jgi:nicotinamidase-related amidase
MPKDRLTDTFTYLKAQAVAARLPGVKSSDVDDFERQVRSLDQTNGGNVLSLGWSQLDKNRPSENNRHAIRAYLLVSIYNNNLTTAGAHAEAVRVKTFGAAWLHGEIRQKLREFLCLDDIYTKAVLFQLSKKGRGTQRAVGVSQRLELRVEDELAELTKRKGTGVVLIDMQSGGDVGQNKYYGGKTILEHQQAVLAIVKKYNLVIYDIVIDQRGAAAFGNPYDLQKLGREEKEAAINRQRRFSYGEKANIQTVAILRDYFKAGTQVRHIPKPTHPAFAGTLFAEHLELDGIRRVVVMGYDANQCIKATVFGVPSETRNEAEGEPKGSEVEAVMKRNSKLTLEGALKLATPMKKVTTSYIPGLLDRKIEVITSRAVMASSCRALESEWGIISTLS